MQLTGRYVMHVNPSVYRASVVEVTQLGRGLFTQAMRLCYMLYMPMPAYVLAISMLHHAACECDALLLRMSRRAAQCSA